jgi:hypothetical protein
MRAYLVKDEGTLEAMARKKFDEDLLTKQDLSRGGISSIEANNSSFGSIMCQSLKAKSRGASSLRPGIQSEGDVSQVNFAPGQTNQNFSSNYGSSQGVAPVMLYPA